MKLTSLSDMDKDAVEIGMPVEMVTRNPSMSQAGFFIRNARHIRLQHVDVTGQIGRAFDIDGSTEVEIIPAE